MLFLVTARSCLSKHLKYYATRGKIVFLEIINIYNMQFIISRKIWIKYYNVYSCHQQFSSFLSYIFIKQNYFLFVMRKIFVFIRGIYIIACIIYYFYFILFSLYYTIISRHINELFVCFRSIRVLVWEEQWPYTKIWFLNLLLPLNTWTLHKPLNLFKVISCPTYLTK